MYREYYNLGGLKLCLEGEESWRHSKACQPFFSAGEVNPLQSREQEEALGRRQELQDNAADHTIHISYDYVEPQPPSYAVWQNCICRWRDHETIRREGLYMPDLRQEAGEEERFCLLQSYDHQYASFMERQGNLTRLHLTQAYRENISSRRILEESGIFDLLADYGMLVLHSAYIVTSQGQAILFSGPSGAGKSTQAELWATYAGARVVNGDRALVRIEDGTAHGIFYAGTSDICHNLSAPVRAIVFPRRGEENRVTCMHPHKAFISLLGQCSYYTWASDSAERMMDLAAELIRRVPVYSLECRKDQNAVRSLAEALNISIDLEASGEEGRDHRGDHRSYHRGEYRMIPGMSTSRDGEN